MTDKITKLQMAEATGYILRSDGSQIISSMASQGDLIYHMGIKHQEEVENKISIEQAIRADERAKLQKIVAHHLLGISSLTATECSSIMNSIFPELRDNTIMTYKIIAIDPNRSVTITELDFVKKYGKPAQDLLEKVRAREKDELLTELESWLVDENAFVETQSLDLGGYDFDTEPNHGYKERNELKAELRAKVQEMKGGL